MNNNQNKKQQNPKNKLINLPNHNKLISAVIRTKQHRYDLFFANPYKGLQGLA